MLLSKSESQSLPQLEERQNHSKLDELPVKSTFVFAFSFLVLFYDSHMRDYIIK